MWTGLLMSCVNLCADIAGSLREEMNLLKWISTGLADIYLKGSHILSCCRAVLSPVSHRSITWYRNMTAFDQEPSSCPEVRCLPAEVTAMPFHSNLWKTELYSPLWGICKALCQFRIDKIWRRVEWMEVVKFSSKILWAWKLLHHRILWRASEHFCDLWAQRFLIIFWTIGIPSGMCLQHGMKPALPFLVIFFSAFMPAKLCQDSRLLD